MGIVKTIVVDRSQLFDFAKTIASNLKGGELIVLTGDLGAGKTTFARDLAEALGSEIEAQSPSFTIENVYPADRLTIHHFDFYRLEEPGVVGYQLQEALSNKEAVVLIEWPNIVEAYLADKPQLRLQFDFQPEANSRQISYRLHQPLRYLMS